MVESAPALESSDSHDSLRISLNISRARWLSHTETLCTPRSTAQVLCVVVLLVVCFEAFFGLFHSSYTQSAPTCLNSLSFSLSRSHTLLHHTQCFHIIFKRDTLRPRTRELKCLSVYVEKSSHAADGRVSGEVFSSSRLDREFVIFFIERCCCCEGGRVCCWSVINPRTGITEI